MSSGDDDPFRLVGQQLEGRFLVESVVATGGFGTVYVATHAQLRNKVALKVLRVPDALGANERSHFVEAFENEARALAQLAHPAIVRALDFGSSRMPSGVDAPWMSLEWIEGYTLRDDLRARLGLGGRKPEQCLAGLRPVFDALGYAHRVGLAHRDVKPANLMYDTRAGSVKLLDFGIAKVMSPDESAGTGQTRTQGLWRAYSPSYAAPEQITASRTGPWTDVHALALILTEMLTDRPAYRLGPPQALIAQAIAPSRPSPGAMGFDVGAWEPVILRALALQPKDRFADAHEFLAALEAALGQIPSVTTAPPIEAEGERTVWQRSSQPGSQRVSHPGTPSKPRMSAEIPASSSTSTANHRTRSATQHSTVRALLVVATAVASAGVTMAVFRYTRAGGASLSSATASIRDSATAPQIASTPVPTSTTRMAEDSREGRPTDPTPGVAAPSVGQAASPLPALSTRDGGALHASEAAQQGGSTSHHHAHRHGSETPAATNPGPGAAESTPTPPTPASSHGQPAEVPLE